MRSLTGCSLQRLHLVVRPIETPSVVWLLGRGLNPTSGENILYRLGEQKGVQII